MLDPKKVHNKIINILNDKGPSLPINIAKEVGMSSLFISAFLSELTKEKRVKISNLKVGGTPLYLLEGQEEQLENFYKFLHPKEAEAFLLLKKRRILKDLEQDPAIRVALRSIRDFAIGFKNNEEIYWKYFLTTESELNSPKKELKKQDKKTKEKEPQKLAKEKTDQKIPKKQPISNQKVTFNNPLIIKEKPKEKKEKPKSDFVQKIKELLNETYKIIEEKSYKPKEYNCLIKINSDLGPLIFLTQAKDKKSVSETDLKKLLSKAQSIPLPALFIATGKLSKKAIEFAEKYSSIIKVKKIS